MTESPRFARPMRRLVLMLAATLCVAGPLASSGMAAAKDHQGRGEWRQQQARGENRGGGGENRGGGRWRDGPDRGGYPRGGDPRGDPRNDPRGDPRAYERAYPRGGDPRGDPRAYGPREPDERVIQDHARYRLRPPPRGFAWVHMASGGFALIQESTGQVFDTVPGR